MIKGWNHVLFWGALWGIVEATVGHLLHLVALPLGWLFWFPIAVGFMQMVYSQTKQITAVFYAALVAAAIKMVDLMVPVRIDYVLNPAVSIILEGLAVVAVFWVLVKKNKARPVFTGAGLVAVSTLWRLFYLIYVHFLPERFYLISPAASIRLLLDFILIQNAGNILTLYLLAQGVAKTNRSVRTWRFSPHPTFAVGVLLTAVVLQWWI